ncbi:MAG TPA: RNA polymerase sigma-70 factor [Verrucomicrobiae bacterium]|nr:RNA polymerase sigma-70 factor [Verrucomicrobiae bacterium]
MLDAFNEHRGRLFGIAYRMLGSVAEADDLVQETWLRWQKQDAAAIRSPQAWLVSTVTRLCIDQLRSARRQREEYYGVWLPEPLVEGATASPDERLAQAESLTMAFMLMLETLGPVERAVFLLREVFDYDYADIGEVVGKTEANCRQLVRRARAQWAGRPAVASPPTDQARRVVEQFVAAAANGRVEDLLELLTQDATLYSDGGGRVIAAGRPIQSADHVSRFLIGIQARQPAEATRRFIEINGRPGVLLMSGGKIYGAISFDLDGSRVRNIYIVRNPDKLQHVTKGVRS